jgi:Subtilase family
MVGRRTQPRDDTPRRELIVVTRPDSELRVASEGVPSARGTEVTALSEVLESEGAILRPLFGGNEQRTRAKTAALAAETGQHVPDLSVYYRAEAPEERLDELARRLRELEVVEAAYVKPMAQLPQLLNDMLPRAEEPPLSTPDFTERQGYLNAAPEGVDARWAWMQPGGDGSGVRIIDIEGAWRFTHEDLVQNQGGVVGGNQINEVGWRDHGTAVLGEFGGDRTSFGVVGICPGANIRAISHSGLGSAEAIRQAADLLMPGDIMLLEMHRPGPRFGFEDRDDQMGYIAVEWWPDDYAAIRYAVSRGIIVVEAAGNGAEDLDDPMYDENPGDFPDWWRNPFRRNPLDSGAILVGAGAPPPGTHGRDFYGPDRSRLDFSNWGSLIDAQGWGREVTTCGYGDLQGGVDEDQWYTDEFSGTSSASPMVVGVLGCVQGILRQSDHSPLEPDRARELLRSTGSPQRDAPDRPRTQRIGNRPDLRQLVAEAEGDSIAGNKPRITYQDPDPAFTTILPTLMQTASLLIMLPATLPTELKNVAIDSVTDEPGYEILFLTPDADPGQLPSQATTRGRLTAWRASAPAQNWDDDPSANFLERVKLPDGTVAKLYWVVFPGGSAGQQLTGTFVNWDVRYQLDIKAHSPEGRWRNVARQALSTMVTLPPTKRVEFAPGATSAVLEAGVLYLYPDRYLFGAQAGQQMTARISTFDNGAFREDGAAEFRLYDPSREQNLAGEGFTTVREWSGVLPTSGDYTVEVGIYEAGHRRYKLEVAIE